MHGNRKRTPIPIPEREAKARGAGPVITYTLSPEELEEYRRKTGYSKKEEKTMVEKLENQLTKEEYLKLRLEGKGRTEIMKKHFRHSGEFYKALEEWGIKEKDAEDRELDLLQPQTAPSDQKTVVAEAESPQLEPKQESSSDDLVSKIEQLIKEHDAANSRAAKIKQWAIDRNLHTGDPAKQMLKLGEEFGELCQGMAKGNRAQIIDSIGDIYVVLSVLSLQLGLNIEACIQQAYNEIKDRKGRMINGVFVKESDITA